MPKTPIDYSKTIIYKLVCKDLDVKDLYVGHTTNWKQRKSSHKSNTNNSNSKSYNLKVYKMMRDNGGWDNWVMIEIEKYPCNDENEARARERFQYEQLHASMNTQVPNRTDDEYKEYYKDIRKEKMSTPEMKEHKKEYNKEYRKNNFEKLKQNNKQWREDNKEILSDKAKKRYEKNKEKILLKNKIKISCSCGSEVRKCDIKRHERTSKHKKYIEAVSVIQRVEEILNQDMNTP